MGRALILAGSQNMAGAAVLAVGGALRCGAGYAQLACPPEVATAVNAHYPEAVLTLYPAPPDATTAENAASAKVETEGTLATILAAAEQADAICIGPGLGTHPATQALTGELLAQLSAKNAQIPLIVDADALNHIAADRVSLAALNFSALVTTPHPGEAARLLNWSGAAEVQEQRASAVRALVAQTGGVVVLKGEGTLVSSADSGHWRNTCGNPGMATAGSGDVLSGMLTALLARGMAPFDAARLAVFLHGRAGDLAAAELGQESLIASDLIRFLPVAILEHSAGETS